MTLYVKSPQKDYARQRSMPLIREDLSLDYKLQGGKTQLPGSVFIYTVVVFVVVVVCVFNLDILWTLPITSYYFDLSNTASPLKNEWI